MTMTFVRHQMKRLIETLPYMRSLFADLESLKAHNTSLQNQFDRTIMQFQICQEELKTYRALPELETLKDNLGVLTSELKRYKTWAFPGHFYSPVPDIEALKEREQDIFSADKELRGIDLNEE